MKPTVRVREKVTDLAEYRRRKTQSLPQKDSRKVARDRVLDEVALHLLMAARAIEAGRL